MTDQEVRKLFRQSYNEALFTLLGVIVVVSVVVIAIGAVVHWLS